MNKPASAHSSSYEVSNHRLTHTLEDQFIFESSHEAHHPTCIIRRRLNPAAISIIRLSGEGSVK